MPTFRQQSPVTVQHSSDAISPIKSLNVSTNTDMQGSISKSPMYSPNRLTEAPTPPNSPLVVDSNIHVSVGHGMMIDSQQIAAATSGMIELLASRLYELTAQNSIANAIEGSTSAESR